MTSTKDVEDFQLERVTLEVPKTEYETAGVEPLRVITKREDAAVVVMMTEIGPGVFVGWDRCNGCGAHVAECACAGGPKEADYVKRWREERQTAAARTFTAAAPKQPQTDQAAGDSDTRQNVDTGLDNAKAALAARAASLPVDF